MRNDLHRAAEVIPAPFLLQQQGINTARGDVVGLFGVDAGEAFVMAEVEVGFRPVFSDEHFAMLHRTHRARVYIEIRVELAQPHLVAALLQQRAKAGRGKALTERGDDPAGK